MHVLQAKGLTSFSIELSPSFPFLPLPFHAASIRLLRIEEVKRKKKLRTYPTMFEQPIVRELEMVRVHLDRKRADMAGLSMQSFNLLLGERVAALFWVDPSLIQNFILIVVR